MLSSRLSHRLDRPLAPLVRHLARFGVSPNMLTVAGLTMNLAAGVVLAFGSLFLGGVFVLIGGFLDILDGTLARVSDKQSRFGGVLDSSLDRYSDIVPILGLMVHFSGWHRFTEMHLQNMILCCAVIVGTFLVPYVRARAEPLVGRCDVGIAERAERVIIFAGGLITGMEGIALWILAIITHLTVIQRLYHTHHRLREHSETLGSTDGGAEEYVAPDAKSEL